MNDSATAIRNRNGTNATAAGNFNAASGSAATATATETASRTGLIEIATVTDVPNGADHRPNDPYRR